MHAARETKRDAPAAPIRRAGQQIRTPLVRGGLVLAALSVVCLVVPAVSSAAGGGRTVAHRGKATFVVHTGAPAHTTPASTVVVVHKGKATSAKVIPASTGVVLVARGHGSGKSAVAATHQAAFAGRVAVARTKNANAYGALVLLILGWATAAVLIWPSLSARRRRAVVPKSSGATFGREHSTAA